MTRHQAASTVSRHRAIAHPVAAFVIAVGSGAVIGAVVIGVSWLLGMWLP